MQVVNIHEAKTHLSALLNATNPFVIANHGKPKAVVVPYCENEEPKLTLFGAVPDLIVPDDFDEYMKDEIATLFGSVE